LKKVIVASINPVKIEAAQIGFARMFPDESFDVQGVSAPSDISEQPMSSNETLMGATNRAEKVSKLGTEADYWIGIEGGVEDGNEELEVFAWVVVKTRDRKIGKGKTGSFFLPQKIAELVRQGVELGEADDIVFGRTNSKQTNGAIGILTDDVITRTTYYVPAVIMALIPFKNKSLYYAS